MTISTDCLDFMLCHLAYCRCLGLFYTIFSIFLYEFSMNNDNFINQLDRLAHDRFALDVIGADEYRQFYQDLLSLFDITSTDFVWYLLGTDGCHLCDDAHRLYQYASRTTPLPPLQMLDLADIIDPDHRAFAVFGMMIPVLITPTRLLCYPFGVMDIMALTVHPQANP